MTTNTTSSVASNVRTIAPGVTMRQRADGTLTEASRQWATRPDDERFDSLTALHSATVAHRNASKPVEIRTQQLRARNDDGRLVLVGPNAIPAHPTHWAFGQASARVGAPAGYLRALPTDLAVDCLNHGLASADDDADSRVLLRRQGDGEISLRAFTSMKYARVWNFEVASALLALQANNPNWTFPTAFKQAGGGTVGHAWGEQRELPVAFASDHDMFVFLCDYEHGIKVDGQDHELARGFFVENSEVGASALKITTFLFDFVCANVLVWGAKNVTEISMRHVGSVRERFLGNGRGDVLPVLRAFADESARTTEEQIRGAQRALVADTTAEIVPTLFKRRINGLTKAAIGEAVRVAESTPRYGDPRSVWAIANGLTEVSQRTTYTDERIALDRAAGDLLSLTF